MRKNLSISILLLSFVLLFNLSCRKENDRLTPGNKFDHEQGHLKQTKTYSSSVLTDWIKMDLQLLRDNPTRLNNFVMLHHWAYSSIALYEAVAPGMPSYQSLYGQLNEMPAMPAPAPGKQYHWPTTANAVLASMIYNFYHDSITQASRESIVNLENSLNVNYQQQVDALTFERSKEFGQQIATRVFQWALTDGYVTSHPPYLLPVGPGQWEKTPTAFQAPQRPYWGTNRPLMKGSVVASALPAPPSFSTDPASDFHKAAKAVFDVSQNLTADEKAQVLFWRDVPGGGHAHWLSIFLQTLYKEGNNIALDQAALLYAKLGISQNDARISCWKAKYQYNLIRPVSYINANITNPWNSFITTPNHPEYPSAHSSFSAPAAYVLTRELGDNYSFIDDSYNFLSLPARTYSSFYHAADEAGESRVLGGLHYRFSITAGNTWEQP